MLGPKAAILDDHDALEVTEAELVRDIGGQTRSIGAIPDVMRGRVKGLDANVQLMLASRSISGSRPDLRTP